MRWIPSRNAWAVWHEQRGRWQLDSLRKDSENWGAAVTHGISFLASLGEEAVGIAAQLGSRSTVRDMLELAKTGMFTPSHDFDAAPNLLGCGNGVVDLHTGKLRPSSPSDMILLHARADYDPKADMKLWKDFLRQATFGDRDLVNFLQLYFGYSLLGVSDPEWFVMLQGPGGSGKGTFSSAVCRALGEYALVTSSEAFAKRRSDSLREDITHFESRRLVAALEMPDGTTIDHRVIKSLTGGDVIRTRGLFQESREIRQTWSLVAACNQLPKLTSSSSQRIDSGWWRRVVVIPFRHVPRVADPNLKRVLTNPSKGGSQVLRWLVEGCLEARRRPNWWYELPEAVKQATAEYRVREDHASAWLGDCFTRRIKVFTPWASVRRSYHEFCRVCNIDQGDRLKDRDLRVLLAAEGFQATRGYSQGSTQKRGWLGPGLIDESRRVSLADFVEDDIAGELGGGKQ